ncbi:MAG: Na+/proline symporter [Cyclobacteriaceae bacterium]
MAAMFPINKLVDKLTEYLKVKGDQLKLDVLSQVARILAYTITFILIGLIASFLVLFISLTLALYLNHLLESVYLGYVIISGVILILLIILILLLKTQKIQLWLESMIIKIGTDG